MVLNRVQRQKISVEKMREIRNRINERQLIKEAPWGSGASNKGSNNSEIPMTNLNNTSKNINPGLSNALKPMIEKQASKVTISSTDFDHIEHWANNGEIDKAKTMLNNMKSVAKVFNEQIMDTENYIKSLEV